jgi:hypothetical protein
LPDFVATTLKEQTMHANFKSIVAAAAAAMASVAVAQSAADNARDTTRDTANAVGRAASAAVTPGDQNMGRNPENRSGGLMGTDRTGTDRTGSERTGSESTTGTMRRAPRADRG